MHIYTMISVVQNFGNPPAIAGGTARTFEAVRDCIPEPMRELYQRQFEAWAETAKPGDFFFGKDTYAIVRIR